MTEECHHPVREKLSRDAKNTYAYVHFDWRCLICFKIIPFNRR